MFVSQMMILKLHQIKKGNDRKHTLIKSFIVEQV